jgi:hypothetical protein
LHALTLRAQNAYKAHGSNASWDWLDTLAPTIEVLRNIARNFNDSLGADQGTRHAPPDLKNDIATLMESLNENNVYRLEEGRVLGEDTGGAVKDVILVGLQSLTEGEKTPLTEYNEAFQRLQRRRGIVSVAEQAQTHQASSGSMATGPVHPSLETPVTVEDALQENEDMSVKSNDEEEERPTELEHILDDLEAGVQEPTLLRLSEEDVSLDMDQVVVDVMDDEGESSDDDDDESEDGGLAGD